eukprot:340974-Chlamydomonas_euryale.AAC.1
MIFKIGEALCAFVRWFKEERLVPGDELAKHGCIPLTWEPDHVSGGGAFCQVIGVRSILAREFIVPNMYRMKGKSTSNSECMHFYVSPFKWDRPLTDISGISEGQHMPQMWHDFFCVTHVYASGCCQSLQ